MSKGLSSEKEKKRKLRIKGLGEVGSLARVRPEQLWSDKGSSFPGPLMARFKKKRQTCNLLRAMGKEQHRVKKYLIDNARFKPESFQDFDDTGTLSHLLMLLMIEFEEELALANKKMPIVTPMRVHTLLETDAERQTEFSQELRRSTFTDEQARRGVSQARAIGRAFSPPEQGEIRRESTVIKSDNQIGSLSRHQSQSRSRTRSSRNSKGGERSLNLTHTRNDNAIEEKWESIPESRVRGRPRNLPNREPNRDGWTRARTTRSSMRQEPSRRIWDSPRTQNFGKRRSRERYRERLTQRTRSSRSRPRERLSRTRSRGRPSPRRERSVPLPGRNVRNGRQSNEDFRRDEGVRTRVRKQHIQAEQYRGRHNSLTREHPRRGWGKRNNLKEADREVEERTPYRRTWNRQNWGNRRIRTDSIRADQDEDERKERGDDAAVALAKTFLEAVNTKASSDTGSRKSGKDKEEKNIRAWALNPRNPALREIGPVSILKNIYQLQNLSNLPAKVFFTLLAL